MLLLPFCACAVFWPSHPWQICLVIHPTAESPSEILNTRKNCYKFVTDFKSISIRLDRHIASAVRVTGTITVTGQLKQFNLHPSCVCMNAIDKTFTTIPLRFHKQLMGQTILTPSYLWLMSQIVNFYCLFPVTNISIIGFHPHPVGAYFRYCAQVNLHF